MTGPRRGALAGATAYLLWGLFPLYWPLLKPAGAVEILAHRVVWSFALLTAIVACSPGYAGLRSLDRRRVGLLAAAALFVAVNWGVYIWGVNHGHVVEASLGYFINPLVTVTLGVVVLGERLRPAQWAALAFAVVAVIVLTVGYGRPPWLAFVLAVSFAFYGLMKKKAGVGAVASLTVETAILFAPALAYLIWLELGGGGGTFGHISHTKDILLLACGAITSVPLLCFAVAANRVPLSTLGMLQYLSPVLQFLCGVIAFHERMPASRWAGFALVWCGLLVLIVDATARVRVALGRPPKSSSA